MAEVWRARDEATGEPVALKCLSPGPAEYADALRDEFARLARLLHPNIVRVHDFGQIEDGTPFFTMELVEGKPLSPSLSTGDLGSFLAAAEGACAALGAIHSAGFVHGDVKPENILIVGDAPFTPADVRLVDLGLSGPSGEHGRPRGTPGFAAPEVLNGEAPTPASDLYSLGATLYVTLSRSTQAAQESLAEIIHSREARAVSPMPLRAAGVPEEIERVVLALLEIEPQNRPRSAEEVWENLAPLTRRLHRESNGRARKDLVRGVLVGRDRELGEVLGEAGREGPVVLVTGTEGSGRSRFLRELALRTEVEGGRAAVVSCSGRRDGGAEWMRRIRLLAGSQNPRESWGSLLSGLAGSGQTLLALEDLQEASSEDLEVARRALSARTPAGVSVVLSWAEPAPVADSEFEDFRLLAHGEWLGEAPKHVKLEPLGVEMSSELVRLLLGGTHISEVENVVHRRAAGLPAWIDAALTSLIDRRALVKEEDRWRLAPEADLEAPLPEFENVVEAGVRALDAGTRRWLAALGELGGEAIASVVAVVAGADRTAEEETVSFGFAVRHESGGIAWVRAQPVAACAKALSLLGDEEVRAIRVRAAEALEKRPRRAANLWLLVDEPEKALEVLGEEDDESLPARARWAREQLRLDALERTGRVEAPHLKAAASVAEAAEQFNEASELWKRFIESSVKANEIAEGHLRAAVCRRSLADYPATQAHLDACEEALPELENSNPSKAAQYRSAVLNERSWISMTTGDLEGGVDFAKRSLNSVPSDSLPEQFTAWLRLCANYSQLGEIKQAEDALGKAFRLSDEMGDELAQMRAHGNAHILAKHKGDTTEERRHVEAAYAISRNRQLKSLQCRHASAMSSVVEKTGSLEEMRQKALEAESLAREAGDVSILSSILNAAARVELRAGNIRKGWNLSKAALSLGQQLQQKAAVGMARNRLGMIYSLLGRKRKATRSFSQAIEILEGADRSVSFALCNKAEMLLDRGNSEEANELFAKAGASSKMFPAVAAFVARARARFAARLGDVNAAKEAVESVSSPSILESEPESHALFLEAQAFLAYLGGEIEAAVRLWNEAIEIYRQREYPVFHARCMTDAARTLAGHTGLDPRWQAVSIQWLRETRSIYERIGAPGPLQAVLADLVRLQEDSSRSLEAPSIRDARDTLFQVSEILNSLLDLSEMLKRALRLVAQRLNADRGLIILLSEDSGELDPVAQIGQVDSHVRADALQISTTVVRQVAETGAVFRSHDATADPRLQTFKSVFDLSLRSILCAPLRIRSETVGTIYLQNRTANKSFTDDDIELLESFSNLIAIAIEKSRYQEGLRRANESLVDENVTLRREVGSRYQFTNLVGQSREMREVNALIDRFSRVPTDILIQGETGTGKELVAKTIHYNSSRKNRPFMSVSCVALPETLIEAELFGIEDHVATGVRARKGIFEQAEGGSVLLDEIGDMPLELQARLLRVLQEREFTRVGGRKTIPMDVRVIAATNADLQDRVREGRFREDLYFRVKRLVIDLPPLRDRKSDIPVLAKFFLDNYCAEIKRSVPKLSPELLEVIGRSSWPGNVRELEHYMESLLVLDDGPILEPKVLPGDIGGSSTAAGTPSLTSLHGHGADSLQEALNTMEHELIEQALRRAGGNRSRAARLLGMAEPTLRYRLRKLRDPGKDST
jgi:Nif-specific regulatory protein